MKHNRKVVIITFAVFVLSLGFNAKSHANVKIGLIDMTQIVKQYDKAQDAQASLQLNQKELNKMISNAREEVKKIKEEKNKKEKEKKLTKEIMEKSKTYRQNFLKKWQKVQNDILITIKKVADENKYDLVMDKNTVIAGGEDITKKVLSELKN